MTSPPARSFDGPILVFGGVYSNAQALDAVFAFARARGISSRDWICTGDVIAYGADARACLARLRATEALMVAGNCEEGLATGAQDCGCGFAPGSTCDALSARWWDHARKELDEDARAFLATLPKRIDVTLNGRRLAVLHGAQDETSRFVFASAPARVIAQEMAKPLGQTVVVELKPGAGGNLGAEQVAKSARADGYTFLFASVSLATSVSLSKLNFDPRKDLVAVAGVASIPSLMLISNESPYKTVREVVAAIKDQKLQASFGSSGYATGSHLVGELFKATAGIDMLHVPYKGSGAVYPDLMAGRVTLLTDVMGSALGQVKGGKVRGLAVTSTQRSAAIPELPTVNEALGLKDYELIAYFAMFAPAGTPADIVAKFNQAINAAANNKELQEKFAPIGFSVEPGTPEALARRTQLETAKWAKAIKDAKIEPQ